MSFTAIIFLLFGWGVFSVIFLIIHFLATNDYFSLGEKIFKSVINSFFFILFGVIFYFTIEFLNLDLDSDVDYILGFIIFFILSAILYQIMNQD